MQHKKNHELSGGTKFSLKEAGILIIVLSRSFYEIHLIN